MQKISLWSVFTVGGFMSSCENSFSWVRNRAWIMNLNTTPYRQGWMASSKSNLQTFRDNMCFRKLRSPRTPYMFHQNDAKRLFFRDNSSYRQKLFLNRTIAWWNSDVGGSWHCVWGHLKLHSMHKHFLTSFFSEICPWVFMNSVQTKGKRKILSSVFLLHVANLWSLSAELRCILE